MWYELVEMENDMVDMIYLIHSVVGRYACMSVYQSLCMYGSKNHIARIIQSTHVVLSNAQNTVLYSHGVRSPMID